MKKLLYTLTVMFSILSFTACDNDVKDKFDESSADRMSKALKEYQKILVDAPNGWLMEYYAGGEGDEMIGGYTYLCSFDKDGKVVVSSDLDLQDYPVGSKVESLYDLIAEQGPILSFNTNNALLHFFSTASGSKPKGYKGDYEFVLMEVTPEKIVMKGRRYENMIVMRPMSNSSWNDCLAKISTVTKESRSPGLELFVNGESKGIIEVNYFYRSYDLVDGDISFNAIYTEEGIRLYKPADFGGIIVENFKWDSSLKKYISSDSKVELRAYYPPGYIRYNQYIGNYDYKDNYGIISISIEADVEDETFLIKGLCDFDLVLDYDITNGAVLWSAQTVAIQGGVPVELSGWAARTTGNLYPGDTDFAFIGRLAGNLIKLEPNAISVRYGVDSFILWKGGVYPSGKSRFVGPFTMTKQ